MKYYFMRWFMRSRILGKDDGPLIEEEYFAVLVANIYISEKGKSFKDLRYRYNAFSRSMMKQKLSRSFTCFNTTRRQK